MICLSCVRFALLLVKISSRFSRIFVNLEKLTSRVTMATEATLDKTSNFVSK